MKKTQINLFTVVDEMQYFNHHQRIWKGLNWKQYRNSIIRFNNNILRFFSSLFKVELDRSTLEWKITLSNLQSHLIVRWMYRLINAGRQHDSFFEQPSTPRFGSRIIHCSSVGANEVVCLGATSCPAQLAFGLWNLFWWCGGGVNDDVTPATRIPDWLSVHQGL